MAGQTISGATQASAFDGTEAFPLVQSGAARKGLISQLLTYLTGRSTVKSIVADPAAVGGGSGTWAAPYTPSEAAAAITALPSYVTEVELLLKPGVHRISYIFDAAKQLKVAVRGLPGKLTQILSSTQVTGGWTQDGTYPNLWYRTWTDVNSWGAIDVTAGQSVRHWSGAYGICWPAPFRVYFWGGQNVALATLNGTPYGTTYIVASQRIYINTQGLDPNTRTFEIPSYYAGIQYTLNGVANANWSETGQFSGKVLIENVECRYAYASGIYINRAHVELRQTRVFGSFVSHGFTLKDCSGIAEWCGAFANLGDGFNPIGQVASVYPDAPVFEFRHTESRGNFGGSADGFSNHEGQIHAFIDCIADGNAKDGFSCIDSHYAINCSAINNLNNGLSCQNAADKEIFSIVKNFYARNNYAGLKVGSIVSIYSIKVHWERPILDRTNRGIYITNSHTKTNCGLTSGTNIVTCADTSNLAVGMPVGGVINSSGIPPGSKIGSITTNTSFTVIDDVTEVAANSTLTNAAGSLGFAVGGVVIAPQYVGNAGFTIATQSTSAIAVQTTFTTS